MIICYYRIWAPSPLYDNILVGENPSLWVFRAGACQTEEGAWGLDPDRSGRAMIRWEWHGRTNSIGNWYLTNPQVV